MFYFRYSDKIKSFDAIPVLAVESETSQPIDFGGLEWKVLAWIDGSRSIKEIMNIFPENYYEILKAIALLNPWSTGYTFLGASILRFSDQSNLRT